MSGRTRSGPTILTSTMMPSPQFLPRRMVMERWLPCSRPGAARMAAEGAGFPGIGKVGDRPATGSLGAGAPRRRRPRRGSWLGSPPGCARQREVWRQRVQLCRPRQLQVAGKLSCPAWLAAIIAGSLVHILDENSGMRFLVDTGANFSIIPHRSPTAASGPRLFGPSGLPIACWGERVLRLRFNGRDFTRAGHALFFTLRACAFALFGGALRAGAFALFFGP